MAALMSVQHAVDALARDPLRHIVLLKHLIAYPRHVTVHRVRGAQGTATMVVLETAVSPYDRQTYPKAAVAALIESDHPELTASLMSRVPRGVGIVFKLSREADLAAVNARFPLTRRTAPTSFTSADGLRPDPGVHVTASPGAAAFELFEAQGHARAWLEPLLQGGGALACVLESDGDIRAACIAFENYGPVWEVGGVVTPAAHRRQGFATRVVRTAVAELARQGLTPRYQVEEHNTASIRLAQSVGLAPFLTIVHYEHECRAAGRAAE
jgi:RimJ/RimL family protein N-acetyltransferase